MNFLAPLFLAGAAAIALPIFFHLIRRSSREKFIFSSLMFLDPSPPRITKRSRLEHLLLLLLRALVLCLLALAFARPFLPKAMNATGPARENTRVAILLDTSGSMRREDLWQQAKSRAAAILRTLQPNDSVAVYGFDQQMRTILSFADAERITGGERAAAVEARLTSIEPGWAGTHLGNAMLIATENLIEQLNADAQEQGNSSLRLVVISDFQSGSRLDGLQGFEWPKKLRVQIETVRAKELFNAHAQLLDPTQSPILAATNSVFRARVHNSTQARGEEFELYWSGSAGLVGEKSRVYVPAGQSKIVALPAKPSQSETLVIGGDAVDFDNRIFAVQATVRPLTVLYWGGEAATDPNAMRYYVHRAFELTNLATRVLALSNSVPNEAREAALLVLGDPGSKEGVGLARELLASGRTVLLPIRDPADANAISQLLGGVLVQATEAPVRNFAMFGRIDFQDPLFAPFADARFSDFTKIRFWKYRALDLGNVTNANVIAAFDSAEPAIITFPVGQGRLVVLASTWKPSDSQFALSSKFIPLLFGMLEQSADLGSGQRNFLIGSSVSLAGETNEVVLPDGKSLSIQGKTFSSTERPGIYRSGDFRFAVNMDPAESNLSPLPAEDLASLGVPLNATTKPDESITEGRERHLLATETEARQKLWRWLVLVALTLIAIETCLATRLHMRPVS